MVMRPCDRQQIAELLQHLEMCTHNLEQSFFYLHVLTAQENQLLEGLKSTVSCTGTTEIMHFISNIFHLMLFC